MRRIADILLVMSTVLCNVCAASSTAHAATLPWARGWPMAGHDPQRTHRGMSTGPLHPRLLFSSSLIAGDPVIGADGTLYGWGKGGLRSLDATGHDRWVVPILPIEGGAPVLAPNGLLLVNGLEVSGKGAAQRAGMAVLAIAPNGTPRWTIHTLPWATDVNGTFSPQSGHPLAMGPSVPLSKGVAPAVSVSNTLYMPFIGPGPASAGLEAIAPTGRPLRRIGPGFPPLAFAVGHDGSLYVLGGEGQNPMLAAFSPRGATRWRHPLSYGNPAGVLVGRDEAVYAALGTGSSGAVVAYTAEGRLLWEHRADGTASLAERADGTLLVATATSLTALAPGGAQEWRIPLGRRGSADVSSPSIAVDHAGYAFVGTADGVVRAVAQDGRVLWALPSGGPHYVSPECALGPDHTLVVAGSDGVLRVYR